MVDEAYIDFSTEESMISAIPQYPNLIVLRTFSKAWGLAGLRVGMAVASEQIVDLINKIKPHYNLSEPAQNAVLEALDEAGSVLQMTARLIEEREQLRRDISRLRYVQRVYESDTNFLLVKMDDGDAVYRYLLDTGLVVRNRGHLAMCEGCLRITVGTPEQNAELVSALEEYPR